MKRWLIGMMGIAVVSAYFGVRAESGSKQILSLIKDQTKMLEVPKPREKGQPDFQKDIQPIEPAHLGAVKPEEDETNVADLTPLELDLALEEGRERVFREKLIERLNKGDMSTDEIREARRLFERLASLSVERANRKIVELAPEFERGLAMIDGQLQEIREILKD